MNINKWDYNHSKISGKAFYGYFNWTDSLYPLYPPFPDEDNNDASSHCVLES